MNIIRDLFGSNTNTMAKFKRIADKSSTITWMSDQKGLYYWFNRSWLGYTGQPAFQEEGIGWTKGIHSDDLYHYTEEFQHKIIAREPFFIEYRMRRHDGVYRWFLSSATPSYDSNQNFIGYNGVCFDITDRKNAEKNLRITGVAFKSQHGIAITDINQNILCVNPAFTELMGYSNDDIVGQTPSIFTSGRHDTEFYTEMWRAITTDNYWQGEVWNRRKDGELIPLLLTITTVKDTAEEVTHYVASFLDFSLRIAKESALRDLAFYDPLTGLANRRLLSDRLDVAFSKSARSGCYGAVLFIDLDNFKAMNDRFGHSRGDDLLETVATRLTETMREEDTVARFGGDEFVVLLEDLGKSPKEAGRLAQLLAEKLHIALNILYTVKLATPINLNVSPSIGVTLFLGHNRSIKDTLDRADKALYAAKQAGRDTVKFLL